MTETEELFSWEGDVCRDMVTYRFIELSIAALATAFERDTELRDKYALWLSRKNDETKPIILYTFEPDQDDSVNIFAMPQENQFFYSVSVAVV